MIRSATSIRERGWLCFLLLLPRTFSTQYLLEIFWGWLMDPCCGLSFWAAQTAHPNRKLNLTPQVLLFNCQFSEHARSVLIAFGL